MIHSERYYDRRVVAWLTTGCILVFAMVVIGGITRLTGSGLSITEWNVIMGAIPPLNDSEWQVAFAKYQASPQYQKQNHHFELPDFKSIFWWEYIHRLAGRIIGIVFIVPFAWFLLKKRINILLIPRLFLIFFLGGLQGFIGWYMVKSGLVDNPRVSHYRLALHLITAFATFGLIFRTILELIYPRRIKSPWITDKIYSASCWLFALVILQIIYGAFVAGLKAGLVYNTFPKMGDEWIASSVVVAFENDGLKSLTENLASIQFIHRCIAYVIVIVYGIILYRILKLPVVDVSGERGIFSVYLTGTVLLIQLLLGIFTLLYHVPVVLGVLHQAGAFLLFSAVLFQLRLLRYRRLVQEA